MYTPQFYIMVKRYLTGQSYMYDPYNKRLRLSKRPPVNHRRTRIAYGSYVRRRPTRYRRPLILRRTLNRTHASMRISKFLRRRKSVNYNAKFLKKQVNLNTSYERKINSIAHTWRSDQIQLNPDGAIIGYFSNDLYVNSALLQLPKVVDSVNIANETKTNTSINIHGFEIKMQIVSMAACDVYMRMVIVRDKYENFPGFRKIGDDKNDGIYINVKKPATKNGYTVTKDMANFFYDVDPDDIKPYTEIPPDLRTIFKINPLRYRVLWNKLIKLNKNNVYAATNSQSQLISTFFPFRKELLYRPGNRNPSNDDIKFFCYVSVPRDNANDKDYAQCSISGNINMCLTSKYNTTLSAPGS